MRPHNSQRYQRGCFNCQSNLSFRHRQLFLQTINRRKKSLVIDMSYSNTAVFYIDTPRPPFPAPIAPPLKRERRVCSVLTCRPPFPDGVVFHRFPHRHQLQQLWANSCQRDLSQLRTKSARVCSQHFLPADYERNLKNELLERPRVKRLKAEAVPNVAGVKMEETVVSSVWVEEDKVGPCFDGDVMLEEKDPLSQDNEVLDEKGQERYLLRGSRFRSNKNHSEEKHSVTEFLIQTLKDNPATWNLKRSQCRMNSNETVQLNCNRNVQVFRNSWQNVFRNMRKKFRSDVLQRQNMSSVTEMKKEYRDLRTAYFKEKKKRLQNQKNESHNKAFRWMEHLKFLDLEDSSTLGTPCSCLKSTRHFAKDS